MTRSNCVKWLLVTLLLAFAAGSCAKDTPAPSEEQARPGSDQPVPPGPDDPGPDDPAPEPETPKLDAGLAAEKITTEDVPDDYHSEWHILTADDLFAWNEASSHWSSEDKIYIDADIDMANRSWRPNDGFSGLFEGNGHRISRILVDVSGSTARVSAFFGRNTTGTIRNITFGSSNGSSYDQSSQIRMVSQYSGDYSYMGIVAEGSPKMSQVKSFVKLALNDGSVGCKVRMGGLVGEAAAGTTLEQCVSSAEVGLNSGTGRPHSLGGLIGYVSGKSSVRNCSNTGAVTSWSPFCLEVGGLVGANKDGVSLTLENSSNKGAVWAYDWATSSTEGYLGGVIGHAGQGVSISSCVNNASVTAQNERNGKWRVGGIAGQADKVDIRSCTNTGAVSGTNRLTGALIGMMGAGASHHGCEARGKVVTPAATATLSFTNCALWARGGNMGGTDGDCYYNGVRACFRGAYCGYTSSLASTTTFLDAKLGMLDVAYYAYVVPQADGSLNFDWATDDYVQGFVNRCHQAGVKVLLTFYSSDMRTIVENTTTRAALVNNLCAAVEKYNFDGVDNDWETPKTSDGSHLTNEAFMQALSARLSPDGRFTTAAITPGKYAGAVRDAITDNTIAACDWLNIMIYDDYSTATPGVNHSSVELFNTSYNYWVGQRNMPASKFIPGLPCYGRPSGVDAAAWLCIPLRTIVVNGGSVDADSADNIPYQGTNYTILYNGRPTIKQKVDLCVSRKNGGYFFWELGEDYVPTSSAFAELNKSLIYYAGNYLKTTYQK